MEISAKELAALLGGTVEGNADVKVSDYAKIEEGRPGTLSFLSNPKYEHYLYSTKADVVLVNNDFKLSGTTNATLVRVPDAYLALAQLLQMIEKRSARRKTGVDPTARVDPSARIGKDCYIGPFVYIAEGVTVGDGAQIYSHCALNEGVTIGRDTLLYNGVVIYKNCHIGDRCILHANCAIGAAGLGFAKQPDGSFFKMPQNGAVIVEDDVEIGATTTVDRGSMGPTILRKGVKLDNQIQIAHNVELGENTAMAACSGIAGSTKVGKDCIIGGMTGIVGHVKIDDHTTIAAYTGMTNSTREPGMIYQGIPCLPINKSKRSIAVYRNLPDLARTVSDLKRQVETLTKQIQQNNA